VIVDVRRDVRPFNEAVRQKGVYIGRPFPPLTSWARITIGTQPEMDKAIPVILDVLKAPVTSSASVHPLPDVYGSWC
jgi:histidinol-phosphate/aromatic aminotransferase/cobyric acid decarboxylase-like protein